MAVWSARPRSPARLPAPVTEVYEEFLRERFPKARGRGLRDDVAELSEAFTAKRSLMEPAYLSRPRVRSAYLAHMHPLQVLRGTSALSEVWGRALGRGLVPERDGPLRVADLGAGIGAMSQALLIRLARDGAAWPDFMLVDHQRAALRDASDLTQRVGKALAPDRDAPRVRVVAANIGDWVKRARERGNRADVVLVGGVLNEWGQDWERELGRLLSVVAEDGLVVFVEPALPDIGRRLMTLRDAFLGSTTTIAPCTHAARCPLLQHSRDWCFTTHAAAFPGPVAELARHLHHQTDEVRYALWAFAPRAAAAPFGIDPKLHGRAVTDVMEARQIVCTDGKAERVPAPSPPAERGTLVTAPTA